VVMRINLNRSSLGRRLLPLLGVLLLVVPLTATRVIASSGPPAPSLLSPSNGAQVTVPFTISWSSVNDSAGIGAYNWQISKSSTFSTITAQNSVHGTQTQDTISGIVNGTYYWEVQAFDNNFILGPWSAPQSFTITGANSGELGPPTLNLPQTGATTFHPYFAFGMSWSAVPGGHKLPLRNGPERAQLLAPLHEFQSCPMRGQPGCLGISRAAPAAGEHVRHPLGQLRPTGHGLLSRPIREQQRRSQRLVKRRYGCDLNLGARLGSATADRAFHKHH
jgi:hypothetical protein